MSTPVMLLAAKHVSEQLLGLLATLAELAGVALPAGDRVEEQSKPVHCVRHELLLLLLSCHSARRVGHWMERHFGLGHPRVKTVKCVRSRAPSTKRGLLKDAR